MPRDLCAMRCGDCGPVPAKKEFGGVLPGLFSTAAQKLKNKEEGEERVEIALQAQCVTAGRVAGPVRKSPTSFAKSAKEGRGTGRFHEPRRAGILALHELLDLPF